jgi:GNAT superfamily N-acetyltransferase
MPMSELEAEMKRVTFFGWERDGELVGVMGLEPIKDTTLIRHAYVLPQWQRQGISSRLLDYMRGLVKTPRLLVGTWADASWAIRFYEKHGFRLLPDKDELLKRYWDIPQRQIETSVVLGIEVG